MKHKQIIITSFVLCLIVLSSCDFFGEKQGSAGGEETSKMEYLSDSIKEHFKKQDSLVNELVVKIDDLTTYRNNSQEDIAKLKSQIDGLQSPGRILGFMALGALLLSIIAIVIVFVKTSGKLNWKQVEEYVDGRFYGETFPRNLNHRLITLENNQKSGPKHSSGRSTSSYEIDDLERRVSALERQAKKNTEASSMIDSSSQFKIGIDRDSERTSSPTSLGNKVLYANLNNEEYFMETFNSNQETCVYKITITSPQKGDFSLISLAKIQSTNGWQDVIDVEANGDCTMAEAQGFTTLGLGQCEKIDDSTWKVTKKLRIKINK